MVPAIKHEATLGAGDSEIVREGDDWASQARQRVFYAGIRDNIPLLEFHELGDSATLVVDIATKACERLDHHIKFALSPFVTR